MKRLLMISIIAMTLLASCANVLDDKMNTEDLAEVKTIIEKCDTLKKMEKKYISDKLSEEVGFLAIGLAINPELSKKIITFRNSISESSSRFRAEEQKYKTAKTNNLKLKNFLSISDASCTPISEFKGYLNLTLDFKNNFEKEILYVVFEYSYTNKYDSNFFVEKVKITDEIAGDFKKEKAVSTKEQYNDAAKFIYKNVPTNKKRQKEFLLAGLNVKTLVIVFKDKTELSLEAEDWEYLEV